VSLHSVPWDMPKRSRTRRYETWLWNQGKSAQTKPLWPSPMSRKPPRYRANPDRLSLRSPQLTSPRVDFERRRERRARARAILVNSPPVTPFEHWSIDIMRGLSRICREIPIHLVDFLFPWGDSAWARRPAGATFRWDENAVAWLGTAFVVLGEQSRQSNPKSTLIKQDSRAKPGLLRGNRSAVGMPFHPTLTNRVFFSQSFAGDTALSFLGLRYTAVVTSDIDKAKGWQKPFAHRKIVQSGSSKVALTARL